MRNAAAVVIALAAVAAGCAGESAGGRDLASAGPSGSLIGEINRELGAMRVTHYQHVTQVDEAGGSFKYDCSGLVDYALGRVLPSALHALPKSSSGRPLAGDIERYLHRGLDGPVEGWQAVARVDQLNPGDVIAWLVTEDSKTGDTGHVMVVSGKPVRNPARRHEWLVRVTDSTLSPHASDSRTPTDTGLGTGTIGLVSEEGGGATAFYWRGAVSERAKPTEIAFGHPKE